ncbi:DUF3224 domain-containing protein [Synoicihabitans lomoniglobus]|uniref:DUF3224 domain-containing protein n=1 Tax=Synoicihabitans lomoniglobus TaxID=2909285 RepID=A0AAE9ZRU6_9BACT|nr:DUF3224 domain-containing protein [Opitutaceae bacterium LMO-M01]WED63076.1 DUF3224 domain-containing protein [Opitutaceae bacterium LMO-M01]
MSATAHGSFDVNLTPAAPAAGEPAEIARLVLDKTFSGDLTGTSQGQMLAIRTATEGSAGYVAMEIVTAELAGKSGTFALQHTGTINRGAASLSVTVVPDSATGELTGLSGTMNIDITAEGHRYTFDYTLPASS